MALLSSHFILFFFFFRFHKTFTFARFAHTERAHNKNNNTALTLPLLCDTVIRKKKNGKKKHHWNLRTRLSLYIGDEPDAHTTIRSSDCVDERRHLTISSINHHSNTPTPNPRPRHDNNSKSKCDFCIFVFLFFSFYRDALLYYIFLFPPKESFTQFLFSFFLISSVVKSWIFNIFIVIILQGKFTKQLNYNN